MFIDQAKLDEAVEICLGVLNPGQEPAVSVADLYCAPLLLWTIEPDACTISLDLLKKPRDPLHEPSECPVLLASRIRHSKNAETLETRRRFMSTSLMSSPNVLGRIGELRGEVLLLCANSNKQRHGTVLKRVPINFQQ